MNISDEAKEALRIYIFDYENTRVYERYKKWYFDCILKTIEGIEVAKKDYDLLGIYTAIHILKYAAWYTRANSLQGMKIYNELIGIHDVLTEELRNESTQKTSD